MQCCDTDLISDLAQVTMTFKIMSGLYLGNYKVQEIDSW